MRRKRQVNHPPTPARDDELRMEGFDDYAGFDGVRATVAQMLAVSSAQIKPQMNQLFKWLDNHGEGDERWDRAYDSLVDANESFNHLYRHLGRTLGYLDPMTIEESE